MQLKSKRKREREFKKTKFKKSINEGKIHAIKPEQKVFFHFISDPKSFMMVGW